MSTQDAIQENAQQINRLQSELHGLNDLVNLASVRASIEDLDTSITGFPQRVKELRSKGYAFEKNLESTARAFSQRWLSPRTHIRNEVTRQAQTLSGPMRHVEGKMSRLAALKNSPNAAKPLIRQVETELDSLKEKANAADRTIRGMFDDILQEANEFRQHLDQVDEMLTQLGEATFGLMPNEAGILAVKATFVEGKEDKNDPKGILFLTDQRLIFERKQEIAKKKVLFITTEKELVQELMMDVPLGMVEEINPTKQGLLKNEDHIDLTFQRDAPLREAHFHLFGQDSKNWKTEIQKARTGEYDQDRAISVDVEAAEEVREVPTICSGCGATLEQRVLRGMDSITCKYCGTVIRI